MIFSRSKKPIAIFFLLIFLTDLCWPAFSYALTNGPSQPEMQKFEPAGAPDLVDLFTGDFKYNIPLMEVDGYPVNLSYQSGAGVEEEASWVGAGWTLNPGVMNRQTRGLPDDFDASGEEKDMILKEYDRKEFKKVGATLTIKPALWGIEWGKASMKIGVYKDNYYGIGASFGAGLDFSVNISKSHPQSSSLKPVRRNNKLQGGLGVDINSDVRDGLDISPSLSLSRMFDEYDAKATGGYQAGLHYNTRAGLKSTSLSFFNSLNYEPVVGLKNLTRSAYNYFGQTYTPSINANTLNENYTVSLDGGLSLFNVYTGVGGEGFYYKERILEPTLYVPAYGYMNYLKGRKDKSALLDFNREKDGVYIPSSPLLPVPVLTNDLFVAMGQAGSQQFKPVFGGNYTVFDREYKNKSHGESYGVTLGFGNVLTGGGRVQYSDGDVTTGKWVNGNYFLQNVEGDFETGNTLEQPVYFKQSGEPVQNDPDFIVNSGGLNAASVKLLPGNITSNELRTRYGGNFLGDARQTTRAKRTSTFIQLSAAQAEKYGIEKTKITDLNILDGYRKPHHLGEITVTDNSGQRMVYGIPVYNVKQQEVSFSVSKPSGTTLNQELARRGGLLTYTLDPNDDTKPYYLNGRDELFNRETTPGYATSFLLSAVLSQDYVDVKGDGVTDDDLGTAIKFKYNRLYKDYKWRAPVQEYTANYNEGLLSDPKDDKASYVYGEKEIWYLDAIDGKTMVAVFETSDRQDGFGVAGQHGGILLSKPLKKLDKIKLYSKADYVKNGSSATPIKTVHFCYDYSTYPGLANSAASTTLGRLTLKKVYFTFGKNGRGVSNPYEFSYITTPVNDGTISGVPQPIPLTSYDNEPLKREKDGLYTGRTTDRWGTYKQSWYNHLTGTSNETSRLNNSEWPYALQKGMPPAGVSRTDWDQLIDRMGSQWQLYQVKTPASSIITVSYESDDYAYVQDRRAMQLYFIKGITTSGVSTGLINADKLVVDLPVSVSSLGEFKEFYLKQHDGTYLDKIYYRTYIDMDNKPGSDANKHWEYVQGYANIDLTNSSVSGNTVYLALRKRDGHNPIAKAAWQQLVTDLPQYAYDGYDNSDISGDFWTAIKSIIQAVKNMGSELQAFDTRASKRGFANRMDLGKSTIRLFIPKKTTAANEAPENRKTGGGLRVKKVQITDEWQQMTGSAGYTTSTYGQLYDYAIRDNDGKYISSSGVASYEPEIGNEENPFREPVNFTEKVFWQKDKYRFAERPFCESYFPGSSVGYSKVTVTPFGSEYAGAGDPVKHTGYTENEFYTARDFPTLVENLSVESLEAKNSLILQLFSSRYDRRVATSQGFAVQLNDMHGKNKSVKIFNKGGDLVSSTQYYYQVKDENAQQQELKNDVPLLQPDGTILNNPDIRIGEDVEYITDVRESVNDSKGKSVGAYAGGMVLPIPLVFPYIPFVSVTPNISRTYVQYNSISAVKLIHRVGIISKVVTTQNGSTINAENLVWDGETGDVVLSRTQNEFNDYTYQFTYPAYRVADYDGMGHAYQNQGTIFEYFLTGLDGSFSNLTAAEENKFLRAGDELINMDLENPRKVWVVHGPDATATDPDYRTIDKDGNIASIADSWMLIRSGKRNILGASAGTVVTSKDPRVNGRIQLDVASRMLDSKATLYKDLWPIPVDNKLVPDYDCSGFSLSCLRDLLITSISTTLANGGTSSIRRGFYAIASDSKHAAHFLSPYASSSACISSFADGLPASSFNYYNVGTLKTYDMGGGDIDYYIGEGDQIKLGGYNINATYVNAEFIALTNSTWTDGALYDSLMKVDEGMRKYCLFQTDECSFTFRKLTSCGYEAKGNSNVGKGLSDDCSNGFCTYKDLFSFTINTDEPPAYACVDPVGLPINPYYKGVLGNWRPYTGFTYMVNRDQAPGNNSQAGGTDIRKGGYYTNYTPFWNWNTNGTGLYTNVDPAVMYPTSDLRSRWVWAGKTIYFDQKGNELESVDALNRYGAALFGYRQSTAIAVGGNSRYNEMAFDGFEDYDFILSSTTVDDCPPQRHLDFGLTKNGSGIWAGTGGEVSGTRSHTGRFSYKLNGTTTILKGAGLAAPSSASVLIFDDRDRYILNKNELAKGFAPVENKQYLLSCWVYDGSPFTNTLSGVTITANGVGVSGTLPVVEGWKKVEIPFTAGEDFTLTLTGSGKYVDDLRIIPFQGQMSSYVYDYKTMRLMAQLDENNFATLYEYDDEGTPVRVKKETEKGVMTIKENRQSLRKRN